MQKTYAVADLHGCLAVYTQIKKMLRPGDVVYVLGDCGDRGPQPWETIKAVLSDSQFICLKGNHEDMLVKAMNRHRHEFSFSMRHEHLYINGGEETLKQWWNEPAEDRKRWQSAILNLPLVLEYTNKSGKRILMTHSGAAENASEEDLLWDRNHFYDWDSDYDYIIHGHTPVPSIVKRLDSASYRTCGGRKINIDLGAVWTHKALLLDLDTLEERIIDFNELSKNKEKD